MPYGQRGIVPVPAIRELLTWNNLTKQGPGQNIVTSLAAFLRVAPIRNFVEQKLSSCSDFLVFTSTWRNNVILEQWTRPVLTRTQEVNCTYWIYPIFAKPFISTVGSLISTVCSLCKALHRYFLPYPNHPTHPTYSTTVRHPSQTALFSQTARP